MTMRLSTAQDRSMTGRVAWVTGAGRGIGRALTLALGRAGARIAACDRDAERLQETAGELTRLTPNVQHFFAPADITVLEQLEHFWMQARAHVGLPDVLIANAGVTDIHHHDIEDLPAEIWQRVINVNLTGTFYTLKTALPYLRENGGGNVLILSSLLGQPGHAVEGDAAYISSKAGLEGLKSVAALEWAKYHINVNSVYPARKVATGFFAHLPEAEQKVLAPANTLDDVVLFLATVPPGLLTNLAVDGKRWLEDPAYKESLVRQAQQV